MMIWIKSDAVFKFTTQYLSYKSVEEYVTSVNFFTDHLFGLDQSESFSKKYRYLGIHLPDVMEAWLLCHSSLVSLPT